MTHNTILNFLGIRSRKDKNCRQVGPLPTGGYQPQAGCGICEECTKEPFVPKNPPKGR